MVYFKFSSAARLCNTGEFQQWDEFTLREYSAETNLRGFLPDIVIQGNVSEGGRGRVYTVSPRFGT
jgi:hypothetical protein